MLGCRYDPRIAHRSWWRGVDQAAHSCLAEMKDGLAAKAGGPVNPQIAECHLSEVELQSATGSTTKARRRLLDQVYRTALHAWGGSSEKAGIMAGRCI